MTLATGFSLVLAGCAHTGDPGGSEGPDSNREIDTEAPGADTNGQPVDSGNPATDTGGSDCDDNSPTAGPWQPGDPIPGWCDYPCEEELALPPDAVEVDLVFGCAGMYLSSAGAGRTWWTGEFYFGQDWSTSGGCGSPDGDWWRIFVTSVWQDSGMPSADRGQGWMIDWNENSVSYWWGNGEGDGKYITTGPPSPGEENYVEHRRGGICISRVRPDHVQGWAYLDLTAHPIGPYASIVYARIDAMLDPHAGMYYPHPNSGAVFDAMSDAQEMLHYKYRTEWESYTESFPTLTYDEAWPWEEITDPDIRQQVYDMYTPME